MLSIDTRIPETVHWVCSLDNWNKTGSDFGFVPSGDGEIWEGLEG